jgi:hypothetical protein
MNVKNQSGAQRQTEWLSADEDVEPGESFKRADRTVWADEDEPIVYDIGGAAPQLVTAPPVILPPKPSVVSVGYEDILDDDSSSNRQDRRVAIDGAEILPSLRGQYKKV